VFDAVKTADILLTPERRREGVSVQNDQRQLIFLECFPKWQLSIYYPQLSLPLLSLGFSELLQLFHEAEQI